MTIHISIDTEASGPAPGAGDMISLGATVIDPRMREPGFTNNTFYTGIIRPVCPSFNEGAYKSIGMTREEHIEKAEVDRAGAFYEFLVWCSSLRSDEERIYAWSDNPAFDWQWVNHGFAMCGYTNPLGHSMRRIGDLYAGAAGNGRNHSRWKRHRITKHTHHPVDDAVGNGEALVKIDQKFDLGLWR